ncbi:MAG TPA: hypothetical protein VND94_23360 [Terriglobia bacterium]|nr:hypothetical protein [Terriglobia bacterium]
MHGNESNCNSNRGARWAAAEQRCEVIDLAAWRHRAELQRTELQRAPASCGDTRRKESCQEAGAEIIAWRPRLHSVDAGHPSLVLGRTARRLEGAAAAGTFSGVESMGVESMQQILDDMRRELDTLDAAVRPNPPAAATNPPMRDRRAARNRRAATMPRWMLEYFRLDAPQS